MKGAVTLGPVTGGHLFVVDGDITKLDCDAWLLPTDPDLRVSESFYSAAGMEEPGLLAERTLDGDPFQPLHAERRAGEPWIWLGDIGRAKGEPPDFYADRGRQWVESISSGGRLAAGNGRERPLVAVNLLGAGEGGAATRLALCDALVPALQQAASSSEVDVALVTWGAEAYSAAQRARARMSLAGSKPGLGHMWEMGPGGDRLASIAGELAEHARLGGLVLFIGAGVSMNAGVPSWSGLLGDLARQAKLTDAEIELMRKMDFRDQAAVLQGRLERNSQSLPEAVGPLVQPSRYSLTHALLASLRTPEAVTTNFDSLYEQAYRAGGRPLTVMSGEKLGRGHPWLLKLHGSVEDGRGEIVLTRQHYQDLAEQRGALLGLLQAMLLTRHMLFVGYSLSDEDFHTVMSDVRRVTKGAARVGTALTLFENQLLQDLWSTDIDVVNLWHAPIGDQKVDTAAAARRLQIFLDLVGHLAADMSGFLLTDGYEEGVLTEEETQLRSALKDLQQRLPPGDDPPSVARVRQLLRTFGGPEAPKRSGG